jgi:hypothetical protein
MADLKENVVVQILKYWPVKYLIVVLLLLLVYSGFYHFYRCHLGLNSRFLWGAAECVECKVVTIDSITKHDTTTKTDTLRITKYINAGNYRNQPKADTSKTASKYDLKGSTFNGPAQVGDGNTQNNFAPPKPVPDETMVKNIENSFPNKDSLFVIEYPVSSSVSVAYAKRLQDLLKLAGYKNISMIVDLSGTYHSKFIYPMNIKDNGNRGVYIQAE